MKPIGTYSKKKTSDGEMTYLVTIPNARRVKGRYYPYVTKFLTDDIDDIEKTVRSDLEISGKVKLAPSSGRGGRVMEV